MNAAFPFLPANGAANTLNIAVTATAQTLALGANAPSDGCTMLITNIGSQVVYLAYGTGPATTTTSMPILPNTSQTFSSHPNGQNLSVIAAATGSTLYVTFGSGV